VCGTQRLEQLVLLQQVDELGWLTPEQTAAIFGQIMKKAT